MLDRLFKHASASRWVLAGAAYAGDGAGILHADVTMWSCGRRGHCAARGAASRGETYLRLGCMLVLAPAGDGLGGAGGAGAAAAPGIRCDFASGLRSAARTKQAGLIELLQRMRGHGPTCCPSIWCWMSVASRRPRGASGAGTHRSSLLFAPPVLLSTFFAFPHRPRLAGPTKARGMRLVPARAPHARPPQSTLGVTKDAATARRRGWARKLHRTMVMRARRGE
ncbi:hypothetical protein B0H15DRAFT_954648 [Mycena belliarum]|uniref:Uncharacterized protein n=1 Tax=Mycena belliarum TaxID=1033014 RepID=A0AAD6XLE6_9AGAR|nr:hypothetical protein B0H15DRAFT_954648 [Mycena belliae]